jgi:hypothetical protein
VETPLARKLVAGEVHDGQKILVDERNGEWRSKSNLRAMSLRLIRRRETNARNKMQVLPLLP